MENIKKNFGFGCMRLPLKDGEIDLAETSRMVDYFLEQGFNYFDTAHGYLQGRSETALKTCLTSRHPRDSYILTNKLTGTFFKTEADIRPFFQSQLEACGVDYFDFYLMHAQSAAFYQHFKKCRAYETAFALKAEGKIKHVGISFHDHAAGGHTDVGAVDVVEDDRLKILVNDLLALFQSVGCRDHAVFGLCPLVGAGISCQHNVSPLFLCLPQHS